MANTSATGGYLLPDAAPVQPQPLDGQDFDRFLHAVLVGVSGLLPTLVRPRWQVEPPNQPDIAVTWMAFGITSRRADTYPYIGHQGAGEGVDDMQRHEVVEVLLSFYGPLAESALGVMRDGLQIAQNREALRSAGMAVVETGQSVVVPTLVKERWQYRADLTLVLRRLIRRSYPVLNFLSAAGSVSRDGPPATESFIATD